MTPVGSVKITAEVYGHLDLGDMREGLNRLHLSPTVMGPGPFAARLLLGPAYPKEKAPPPPEIP